MRSEHLLVQFPPGVRRADPGFWYVLSCTIAVNVSILVCVPVTAPSQKSLDRGSCLDQAWGNLLTIVDTELEVAPRATSSGLVPSPLPTSWPQAQGRLDCPWKGAMWLHQTHPFIFLCPVSPGRDDGGGETAAVPSPTTGEAAADTHDQTDTCPSGALETVSEGPHPPGPQESPSDGACSDGTVVVFHLKGPAVHRIQPTPPSPEWKSGPRPRATTTTVPALWRAPAGQEKRDVSFPRNYIWTRTGSQ